MSIPPAPLPPRPRRTIAPLIRFLSFRMSALEVPTGPRKYPPRGPSVCPQPRRFFSVPTWALQQIGSYREYTGRDANVVAKAARDPIRTFTRALSCMGWSHNRLPPDRSRIQFTAPHHGRSPRAQAPIDR